MSSGRFYFQIEDAVARAMQPFVDQLVSLSKDVRHLKLEESEEDGNRKSVSGVVGGQALSKEGATEHLKS